jgi:hypothetical protein
LAPAADSTTGTGTEAPAAALVPTNTEASGKAETALIADASLWARAGNAARVAQASANEISVFFTMELLGKLGPEVSAVVREKSRYSA